MEPRIKKAGKGTAVGKPGTGAGRGAGSVFHAELGREGSQRRVQQSVKGGQGGELWEYRGQRPDKGSGRWRVCRSWQRVWMLFEVCSERSVWRIGEGRARQEAGRPWTR